MAVDLDNRPNTPDADKNDPAQQYYDDVFNNLTSAEHLAQDGASDQAEEGTGSTENNQSAGTEASGSGMSGKALAAAEVLGSGFSMEDVGGGGRVALAKRIATLAKKRNKTLAGLSIITLLFGGGAGVFFFAAGPGEAVRLAQEETSHGAIADSTNASNTTMGELYRYLRSGDPGDLRLGYLGYKEKNNMVADLDKAGLVPEFGANKVYSGFRIDPSSEDSKFYGQDNEQIKATLAENGITKGVSISDSGVRVTNEGFFNYANKRNTLKFLVSNVGESNIPDVVRVHWLAKYGLVTWHPLRYFQGQVQAKELKVWAAARDKFLKSGQQPNEVDPSKATVEDEDAKGNKTTTDASSPKEPVTTESSSKTLKAIQGSKSFKVAGGLAAAVGLVCTARSVDQNIGVIRYAQDIAPLMRMAFETITIGQQVEAGKDVNTQQLALVSKQYYDDKNKSSWASARTVQEDNGHVGTGQDIDGGLKSTLTSSGPSWLAWTNEGPIPDLCSGVGQAITTAVSVTVGVISGGVINTAGSFAASALLVPHVVDWLSHILAGDAVDVIGASGAVFGNDIKYGAQYAGNAMGASEGGIKLTPSEVAELQSNINTDNEADFSSHNLAYKLFNTHDEHSLVSQVADSQNPAVAQNVASLASGFTHLGATLTNTMASLFSTVVHAAPPTTGYDYPMGEVGFSEADLNNPAVQNPYTTGVGTILDNNNNANNSGEPDYIDRARKCFDIGIQKTTDDDGVARWDAIPGITNDVNTLDVYDTQHYDAATCASKGDLDWLKVRMFIKATSVMEGYACEHGDDTSCQNDGYGVSNNTVTSTAPATQTSTNTSSPTIVIDPGHAPNFSHTDSATDLDDSDSENDPEMQDVFDTAQLVQKKLTADGYNVIMTKNSVKDQVSLGQRADIANKAHADLAISIHDQAGSSGGIGFKSGNNIVYDQSVGTYRVAKNGKKITFQNAQVAALSSKYGAIFQQQRQTAQGVKVKLQPTVGYNLGTRGLPAGNIWMVQLLSNVPWIYNEAGGNSAGQIGLSATDKQTYANGLVAGVEKSVPITDKAASADNDGLPLNQATGNAGQVITVTATSKSSKKAVLQEWDQQNQNWIKHGNPITANVGIDGMTDSPSENVSATPIGSFTLTQAFGAKANPGTSLPYFKTNSNDWWDGNPNSKTYNQHVVQAKSPGGNSEQLAKITPQYNYAVVINANMNPVVAGKGSAFFLHVSDGGPTGGCVSIPQSDLVSLMKWLKPADNPRILIGTP